MISAQRTVRSASAQGHAHIVLLMICVSLSPLTTGMFLYLVGNAKIWKKAHLPLFQKCVFAISHPKNKEEFCKIQCNLEYYRKKIT